MSLLWGWISKYVWAGAAVALAASLLWGGWLDWELGRSRKETQEVKDAWTLDRAQATAAALKASTEYRALEAQMQAQSEKAYRDYQAAQSRNESALALARADTGKLRSQLAAYASNAGSTTPDTVASSNQRAAALAGLLAEALRADAESAADAESNGDGVRALLAAWPHEDVAISLPKMKLGQ